MKIRRVARVVVLDPAGAVLLVHYQDRAPVNPRKPALLTYWVPPGGGLQEGETYERAAIRELEEETGIELSEMGRQIWNRERQLLHRGEMKKYMERYFIAAAEPPHVLRNRTEENIEEIRWWTLEQLRASTETFLPEGFLDLVVPIMAGDIPSAPVDL